MKTLVSTFISLLLLFCVVCLPASAQENILAIHIPRVEVSEVAQVNETNSQITLQYFDSAGRLVQNLRKGFSPDGQSDLADYIVYDSLGCKAVEYAAQPFSGNQGAFVSEESFLSIDGWKKTYRYDASAKHRIIATGGVHYGGREITNNYRLNTSSDAALTVFRLMQSGDMIHCLQAPEGIYHVTDTRDEDGHSVLLFSDNYGRTLVKRSVSDTEYYDTYYLYDILDRPVCILPPEATADFESGQSYSLAENSHCSLYCYRYEYDGLNHKTGIKHPGAAWKYIIYDGEDRPVMTQNGIQRQRNEWSFTKYDGLGRVILQGVVSDTRSRQTIASQWSSVAVQEKFVGSGTSFGYSNDKRLGNGNYRITAVYYYDTYDFSGLTWANAVRPVNPSPAHGLLTGRYEVVLNQPDKGCLSVLCYDDKGRLKEEDSYNSLTGQSVNHTFAYNYSNLPVQESYVYNDSIHVGYTYQYDHALRKTGSYYRSWYSNQPVPSYSSLSTESYDSHGRLSGRSSFHKDTHTAYTYYPDGTLKDISNGDRFAQTLFKGSTGTLPYDLPRSYNGNISDIQITQQGQSSLWHYNYDKLNRLSSGVMYSSYAYQTPAGEGEFYTYDRMGNITQLMRDHRKSHVNALYATYSGNQLLKIHDGGLPNTDYAYQTYPDLSDAEQEYYYDAEGNQTANLDKDIVATRYNMLNLPDTIQFGNGNRIINYYLSGGERIRTVSRTYTTPLSVPLDAVTNSTDPYIEHTETHTGSLIYQDGVSDRLLCDGGYLKIEKKTESGELNFHPFSYICDYLGSVRLVCDGKTGEVVQSLEYLPSGLIFRSSNYDLQPNKYTGKELLSMHGLNQYDSNARMQEFQFPIFTTRDPLCEGHYDISPYIYCMNNPINFIDPLGTDTIPVNSVVLNDLDVNNDVAILDEVVIKPSDNDDIPVVTDKRNSNAANFMLGTLVVTGTMIADDATVIGVADDVIVPIIFVGGTLISGIIWCYESVNGPPIERAFSQDMAKKKKTSESDYGELPPSHTKNKTKAHEEKHQRGDKRRDTDRGGDKGDSRRTRYK